MNKTDFIASISDYINRYALISNGDAVLVCVSGGADSVCLLNILYRLRAQYDMRLYVCHVNHMLRDTSDDDAKFVKQLAAQLNLPFECLAVDVAGMAKSAGIGIEDAARRARYTFFDEVKQKYNIDKIATAHNRNDNAETVLMRLLRGSGTDGLKGIDPIRPDGVIRPLLGCERRDIEDYLSAINQPYMQDYTNAMPIYFRNNVRLELLPLLAQEYNAGIVDTLNRTAQILRADAAYLAQAAQNAADTAILQDTYGEYIAVPALLNLDSAIAARVLRTAIARAANSDRDISFDTLMRCYDLAKHGKSGDMSDIGGGRVMEKEYNTLRITQKSTKAVEFCIELPLNTYITAPNGMLFYAELVECAYMEHIKNTAYFDYDMLRGNIYIRSRHSGDKMSPSGMSGRKKVKDILTDSKIPRRLRTNCTIVTAGEDILWAAPFRKSDICAVGTNTKQVLKISCFDTAEA